MRRRNWQLLRDSLAEYEDVFILPNPTLHSQPSWFGFVLSVRSGAPFTRKDITYYLEQRKIQTRNLFAGNILRHPAFDEMRRSGKGYRMVGELVNSDFISTNTFWLGVYPKLSEENIAYMSDSIKAFIRKFRP